MLATKKGITITIGVLAAITSASFLVWVMPQYNQTKFVITDHEDYLNNVQEIHGAITDGIEEEFQNLLEERISPQEYIDIAKISSSQINSQIIQLFNSSPPEKWHESYMNYIESLKKYNSLIQETIVVASLINEEAPQNQIEEILEKINELKIDSQSFTDASDEARP